MCKYCDNYNNCNEYYAGFAMYAYKRKEKILISIFNDKENNNPLLSIRINNNNNNWYDLRINYCPKCGKRLRKRNKEKINNGEERD